MFLGQIFFRQKAKKASRQHFLNLSQGNHLQEKFYFELHAFSWGTEAALRELSERGRSLIFSVLSIQGDRLIQKE